MRRSRHNQIREMLKDSTDGMTARELAIKLPIQRASINCALKKMPDAFIDRWEKAVRGRYRAVYCLADVPEDCPYPKVRNERI